MKLTMKQRLHLAGWHRAMNVRLPNRNVFFSALSLGAFFGWGLATAQVGPRPLMRRMRRPSETPHDFTHEASAQPVSIAR